MFIDYMKATNGALTQHPGMVIYDALRDFSDNLDKNLLWAKSVALRRDRLPGDFSTPALISTRMSLSWRPRAQAISRMVSRLLKAGSKVIN